MILSQHLVTHFWKFSVDNIFGTTISRVTAGSIRWKNVILFDLIKVFKSKEFWKGLESRELTRHYGEIKLFCLSQRIQSSLQKNVFMKILLTQPLSFSSDNFQHKRHKHKIFKMLKYTLTMCRNWNIFLTMKNILSEIKFSCYNPKRNNKPTIYDDDDDAFNISFTYPPPYPQNDQNITQCYIQLNNTSRRRLCRDVLQLIIFA